MPTPETDPRPVALPVPEPSLPIPPPVPAAPTSEPFEDGLAAAEGEEKDRKDKKKKKKDKEGEKSKGVETMFRTSYRTNMDLSALADAKANIMISINGLIVSILLASIAPGIESNTWLRWPTVALLTGCLASLIFAVLAARPRVQSQVVTLDEVRRGAANLLFFGNFAHLTRDEFITGMNELMANSDALYDNMVMDIYGVGLVLQKKYRLLRVSYTMFMLGLVVGIIAFILVFLFFAPELPSNDLAAPRPIPLVPQ